MPTLTPNGPVSTAASPTGPAPASIDLIAAARRSMAEALAASSPCERYAAAHLAALRAAAAVLAARGRPSARRRRVRSVWEVLPEVAPELGEWAAFFAAGARKRAVAEAGVVCVSSREADDLVRDADAFLARVTAAVGLSHQTMLLAGLRHTG